MRIGIDARLNAYRGGGIPQYTEQLLAALARVGPDDELVALQHIRQRGGALVAGDNVARATLLTPPHHRLERWALPVELLARRLDVLHCPDFIAPRLRPCPAVVTIHDLAFLHYPEILDENARRYYAQVRDSSHRADAIIAVSEATRRDIGTLLEIDPHRVDVVYEAAAPVFKPLDLPPDDSRTFSQAFDQGQPVSLRAGTFGLFVSTLEPRKNLTTLFRALRLCHNRRADKDYRLVVAGGRGWHDEPIFQAVCDLRLEESVIFVGSVTQEDLVWLYNACRFYANPSLYEGFGLPVVEALACGAPSLVADTSSLPEVAGAAALLLPPQDAEAWANAIEDVWYGEALRDDLAQRGPLQAQQFSWERAARETLAIYRRVGRG